VRLEAFCTGPRLDLFARQLRAGWVPYRDQTSMFDFEGSLERAPLERAD
jgi:hypothetical protein